MITDFPAKKDYNLGGYGSFLFTPFQGVSSYQRSGTEATITLKAGFDWYEGYATRETLALTEEPQFDENGTCYNTTIAGFVPGDKPVLTALLAEMAGQRYLVQIRDRAGFVRIVGTNTAPLDFSASFSSGSSPTDQKGYTFKFFGLTSFQAPQFEG